MQYFYSKFYKFYSPNDFTVVIVESKFYSKRWDIAMNVLFAPSLSQTPPL